MQPPTQIWRYFNRGLFNLTGSSLRAPISGGPIPRKITDLYDGDGGEVAMMGVITKAMGTFLVLMILLLPYYTGYTKSQETVDETKQHIDEAKTGFQAFWPS